MNDKLQFRKNGSFKVRERRPTITKNNDFSPSTILVND